MISLDSETTGIDLRHGSKPFFVTVCDEKGVVTFWEWPVDPLTREPNIPTSDLVEIRHVIDSAEKIICQNGKFDVKALSTIMGPFAWPWHKTYDTLRAGHILASNLPHNLTDMTLQYLGVNIEPLEKKLQVEVQACRRYCRSKLPDWQIAKEGVPGMPSLKPGSTKAKKGVESESPWKADTWLPRALVNHLWLTSEAGIFWGKGLPLDPVKRNKIARSKPGWEYHPPSLDTDNAHKWWTVLQDYGNADSAVTIELFKAQWEEIKRRKLEKIYLHFNRLPELVSDVEERGVTVSYEGMNELEVRYRQESNKRNDLCTNIARSLDYELKLPKGANNDNLKTFCFDKSYLNLPPVKKSKKTGTPSLDKDTMAHYEATLPENSKGGRFIKHLMAKRKVDTSLSYMEGYRRFWLPLDIVNEKGERLWYRLHPSLNTTGTATLRWSCSNPNEQNISKKPDPTGKTLRHCMGPAPGREWYSADAQNIELRLPAYEAGETAMIDLFEKPNTPPYWGSNHALVAHVLHKEKFEEFMCPKCLGKGCQEDDGPDRSRPVPCLPKVSLMTVKDGFKKKYSSSWYQWVKNGNFAVQYGAQETSGTADRAYHVPGAQAQIMKRFTKIKELNDRQIWHAEKYGYVETIPDRTVDPERGYPMLCTRTEWGRILPTVPLSYHIQGTAMQWTVKAMFRCYDQLRQWFKEDGFDGFMTMQVHDELVFDFPKSKVHPKEDKTSKDSNLWRVRILQQLMAQGGDDIGIPTPVSVEYHEKNWGEGVSL